MPFPPYRKIKFVLNLWKTTCYWLLLTFPVTPSDTSSSLLCISAMVTYLLSESNILTVYHPENLSPSTSQPSGPFLLRKFLFWDPTCILPLEVLMITQCRESFHSRFPVSSILSPMPHHSCFSVSHHSPNDKLYRQELGEFYLTCISQGPLYISHDKWVIHLYLAFWDYGHTPQLQTLIHPLLNRRPVTFSIKSVLKLR